MLTAETLSETFPSLSPRDVGRILAIANGTGDPETVESCEKWVAQCYNRPSEAELKMSALDGILEGFGVECIRDGDSSDDDVIAEYVNMGDTYEATILFDYLAGEFVITSWGGFVEAREHVRTLAARLEEAEDEDATLEEVRSISETLSHGDSESFRQLAREGWIPDEDPTPPRTPEEAARTGAEEKRLRDTLETWNSAVYGSADLETAPEDAAIEDAISRAAFYGVDPVKVRQILREARYIAY